MSDMTKSYLSVLLLIVVLFVLGTRCHGQSTNTNAVLDNARAVAYVRHWTSNYHTGHHPQFFVSDSWRTNWLAEFNTRTNEMYPGINVRLFTLIEHEDICRSNKCRAAYPVGLFGKKYEKYLIMPVRLRMSVVGSNLLSSSNMLRLGVKIGYWPPFRNIQIPSSSVLKAGILGDLIPDP